MELVSISQKMITAGALAALSTSTLKSLILAVTMWLAKPLLVILSFPRANCLKSLLTSDNKIASNTSYRVMSLIWWSMQTNTQGTSNSMLQDKKFLLHHLTATKFLYVQLKHLRCSWSWQLRIEPTSEWRLVCMKFAFLVFKNKTQLALRLLKITLVAVMMLLIMLLILSM